MNDQAASEVVLRLTKTVTLLDDILRRAKTGELAWPDMLSAYEKATDESGNVIEVCHWFRDEIRQGDPTNPANN
jgi:hypothetical protein